MTQMLVLALSSVALTLVIAVALAAIVGVITDD